MNNPVMKQLTPEYKALAIHFDLPFSYIKAYAESLNSIPAGWFLSWFSMVCEPNCEIALSDNQVFDETGLSKIKEKIKKMNINTIRLDQPLSQVMCNFQCKKI